MDVVFGLLAFCIFGASLVYFDTKHGEKEDRKKNKRPSLNSL